MEPAAWIHILPGVSSLLLEMLRWRQQPIKENAMGKRIILRQFCEATMKRNLKLMLVLVLAGFTVLLASGVFAGPQAASPENARHKVIAYYFHTDTRCSTCVKIEQYSHEAIEQGFPNELKNGTLEMRVVNYEHPENRHFMQDYKLVSKSLVLVNIVNGKQTRWTNLKLVWQLTGHKDAFLNYVRKEVRGYLSSI
jgi:hypothetical protein